MDSMQPVLPACISPCWPNHRLILRKPWHRDLRTECSRVSLRKDLAVWPKGRPGTAVREALVVQEEGPAEAVVGLVVVVAAEEEEEELAAVLAVAEPVVAVLAVVVEEVIDNFLILSNPNG